MCGGYKGDRAGRRNDEETGGVQRYQNIDIRGQPWTLTINREIDRSKVN